MNKTKIIIATCSVLLASMQAQAFENVDFTRAAQATVNSVVSIKSYTEQRSYQGGSMFDNDPFFEFFFGPRGRQQQQQPKEPELKQNGLGSGVILSEDGIIVTNNHVINGAKKLEVTLNDNRTFEATVIGADEMTDLAVIRIDATDLPAIEVGESDELQVGEWVLAVGNPFGFTSTVTAGIVSAKARNISSMVGGRGHGIESYIQTDAAVNPGNSGGALVNLKGQLVGINTAIYSQTGNYAGNSFAIPTSIMRNVVEDLTNYGNVQRAVLGLRYQPLTPQLAKEKNITATPEGLYVAEVIANTAASAAGLREGDVIVAIAGQPSVNTGQLQEIMARHRPGDTVTVDFYRDNELQHLDVTLRNKAGNLGVTKPGDVGELGCSFATVSEERCKELGIPSGLEVTNVGPGKFKDAGIREGFIIIDINNSFVTKPDDMRQLYNAIVESTEYDHVMFISGIYPGAKRKTFYAVDLGND